MTPRTPSVTPDTRRKAPCPPKALRRAAHPHRTTPYAGRASGLPALVARHAERTPHALAVVDGDTTLTYAQLVSSARASPHIWTRTASAG